MKQQILWLLLLRVILYTLLLGISFALEVSTLDIVTIPPNLLILYILTVYLVTIGSAFLLLHHRGELRRFAFIQTLIDALLSTILVYLSGGSHSIFTSVFFYSIIAGGLLVPIKGGLIGAASSSLLYGAVLLLEYFGFVPGYLWYYHLSAYQQPLISVNHFAIKGLTFFLAAIVSTIFGTRLKKTSEALSSTQHDLNQLELLYKKIFDNINTGILTINKDNIITSANKATLEITGLQQARIINQKLAVIFPNIDLTHSSPRNACDFKRADGKNIRLGYAQATLQKRNALEKNPETPDEDHTTIITLKDIGEIERLENQMRQAEKLAAIGMMSASIAHDFRNPLTAISGSAQILAQEFSSIDNGQTQNYELTKIILRESERLIKTIADFLHFARPENLDREWFHVRPCLDEILQVCQAAATWPPSCSITIKMDQRYRIWGDEKQLFTVISHLINNALAFCPAGREKLLITGTDTMGPNKVIMSCLTIADNGPGVPPEEMKQIFEPFFTTRPDGTGLGLAITQQTMAFHNGYVVIGKSSLGGAAFSLYFPIPENDQKKAS